ncbi:MAG: hypothetical protein KKB09_00475 [Nanoarchaeota archaeon]|nr:hypothetical protein [Nanoarchaeota archaeon]MBU4451267.1 hypothetical protein [Nanoarchaeota archaeon]
MVFGVYVVNCARGLVFSNIPINLRKEIILVVDDQPITWNVAYIEIKNNTPLGKKILQKLVELEIV